MVLDSLPREVLATRGTTVSLGLTRPLPTLLALRRLPSPHQLEVRMDQKKCEKRDGIKILTHLFGRLSSLLLPLYLLRLPQDFAPQEDTAQQVPRSRLPATQELTTTLLAPSPLWTARLVTLECSVQGPTILHPRASVMLVTTALARQSLRLNT